MENMTFCKQFLDFEPTEEPVWRKRLPEIEDIPNVSTMLLEIVQNRRNYKQLKCESRISSKKDIDFDFLLKFLFNIQTGQKIGLQDEGDTKEVVQVMEESWPDIDYERLMTIDSWAGDSSDQKSSHLSWSKRQNESDGKRKRNTSPSSSSSQESGDEDSKRQKISSSSSQESADEDSKRQKISKDQFDPPYYPSYEDTEAVITETHDKLNQEGKLSKQLQETINLYKGYKHIATEIDKIDSGERHLDLGYIDIGHGVVDLHRILMQNVQNEQNTKPGQFSTMQREVSFQNERHIYPRFETEELARVAVQTLLDKYSDMLQEIQNIPDKPETEELKIRISFKCASLLLFGLLALHPFGDGNGRLARLLCSYSLFTFSPFLTPIFNVFSPSIKDEYVAALVKARQGLSTKEHITDEQEAKQAAIDVLGQKPCDLCALMIESNRYMWKEYIQRISLNKKRT